MGKRRRTVEQIISKLREAEVELAKGQRVGESPRVGSVSSLRLRIFEPISHLER